MPRKHRIGLLAACAAAVAFSSACSTVLPSADFAGSPSPSSSSSASSSPVVGDTPAVPPGVTSFSWTSTATIPGDKTETDYSGCPNGWYVRQAQSDVWGDNDAEPSYTAWTSSSLLKETPGVGASLFGEYNKSGLYQNMKDEFTNFSVDKHHDIMTFWCDQIPTWFNTATGSVDSAKRHPVPTSVKDCYLCTWNSSLQNVATQNYLDEDAGEGVMSGSGPELTLSGTANGSLAFVNNTASYGIWTTSGGGSMLNDAVTTSGSDVNWTHSPNGIPNGGQFIMISKGPGATLGVQLVLADSVRRGTQNTYGSGGSCLADAGGTPRLVDCDATDKSQYWVIS